MRRSLSKLYLRHLPTMVYFNSAAGFVGGMVSHEQTRYKRNTINPFFRVIGYTLIGTMVGITYPISYPLLCAYICKKLIL